MQRRFLFRFCILTLAAAAVAACSAKTPKHAPTQPVPEAPKTTPGKPMEAPPFLNRASFDIPPEARLWTPLLQRLAADGFAPQDLTALFSRPDMRFDPGPMITKMRELKRIGMRTEETKQIQIGLLRLGFETGRPDGLPGDATRAAIRDFQKSAGLAQDGKPTIALLQTIQNEVRRRGLENAPLPEFKTPSSTKVYSWALTPSQKKESAAFLQQHRGLLRRMEQRYGVPAELAVAILTVETRLGQYFGKDKAVVALASMAMAGDYDVVAPQMAGESVDAEMEAYLRKRAQEKGDWAYAELKALLQYAQANRLDPLSIPGSVYGAFGLGQFMPSNALKFGVDGDGNGTVDLFAIEDMAMLSRRVGISRK